MFFDNTDYTPNEVIKKLAPEINKYKDETVWFWKIGKGGYRVMLKELSEETRIKRIEEYPDIQGTKQQLEG